MGILSPWFLAGLGALALPLWLHLLKRHKTSPLPFSSLMFFERGTLSSVKQRRLDYIALLIARLLLLLLIVLAFAQPFLRRANAGPDGKGILVVAIDRSASMAVNGNIERAKQDALTLVRTKPAARKGQVFAFDSRLSQLMEPTADSNLLTSAISSVRSGDERSSFGDLAAALRTYGRSAGVPLEVHLFSDLQKTSMPPAFRDLQLDPGTTLKVHAPAARETANWAVERIVAPARLLEGQPAQVEAVIAGFGTGAAVKSVGLFLNGNEVARQRVNVPSNGRARVSFGGITAPYGLNRGWVALLEGDALTSDDRFNFALDRSDPERVLVVQGPRAGRTTLFLRNAIEAAMPGTYVIDTADAPLSSGLNLEKYAVVVLADSGALSSSGSAALTQWASAGRGVWVIVGPQTAATGEVPLTAAKVIGSMYESRIGDRFYTVDFADTVHPVLAKAESLPGVRFRQVFSMRGGELKPLARVAGDTPVLSEGRMGSGKVLVMFSPLDGIANDLPLNPVFVPFAEQAVRWLTGLEEKTSTANAGDSLDLAKSGPAASIEVLDPDGKSALSLAQSSKVGAWELDRTGFWEVRRPGGRREMVAVNVDRRESDLAPMPADSAELWQGSASGGQDKLPGGRPADPARVSIWPWLLIAAIIAVVAETYVASKHVTLDAR